MISRRQLLKMLSGLPFAGLLMGKTVTAGIGKKTGSPGYRDFYNELGVRTYINAVGTHTYLTGSLMLPEVKEAILYSSEQYVNLNELQDAVGRRLAEMLNSEAAMVTAGAASALTLGTAAAITGNDSEKIRQLPNLPGERREVIIQKSHRYGYDHAVRNTGIRYVEVEGRRQMEQAINSRTVMGLYFNAAGRHSVSRQEFIEICNRNNIPSFIDAAADVPPVEHLWKYTEMGFDMVTFSGGKGLRGPQSAGILLGRKDLIEAARLNAPPHGDTIGRGMKVNKEEILGMMVAVEQYLAMDHEKTRKELEERVKLIGRTVNSVPGVESEIVVQEIGNHVPQLRVWWDRDTVDISIEEVIEKLRAGHPSIETMTKGWLGEGLFVNVWMAPAGQERVVARRLRDVLETAAER